MTLTKWLFLALTAMLLAGCGRPRISILGDSYSTFRGWIPSANADYYPAPPGNDVRTVEQCWWSIVIASIGGCLEKNESSSGSTICNTGYNGVDCSNSSFLARVDRLGNPTLILVCGATNDCWANSPIGDFQWAEWTDRDLRFFRPALARLLFELENRYPKARVFFILNSDLSLDINDSVHRICSHYEVPCIDLHDIDKQCDHPSIKGMAEIAEQVVKAVRR